MSKEIVIIGGGPAGIEAAREAAKLGMQVNLISAGPVGGRAGWHSLLPSKVWLAAAERRQELEAALGDMAQPVDTVQAVDAEAIVTRVTGVKKAWNSQMAAELEALGVNVVQGTAVFDSPNTVLVRDGEGQVIGSFADLPVIVAAGSIPVFTPALKPDGRRVIAPRLLSKLAKLPESIVVVGAGATGCEAAYLFNALGVKVTWIVDQFGILPLFSKGAGKALGAALEEQGVSIVSGQMVETLLRDEDRVTAVLYDGSRHEAEMAFVAIGRRPDWDGLRLAEAGIEPGADGRIHVDEFGRTQNELVYLVGDAEGGIMTANKAQAQGRVAARHIARVAAAEVQPFDLQTLVQPVYTEPQVAQVGTVEAGDDTVISRVSFTESMKAHLMIEGDGFLELAYGEQDGRILGAMAVGPHAADVVSPVALAIKLGARVDDLAAVYGAYPSLSELAFVAARK